MVVAYCLAGCASLSHDHKFIGHGFLAKVDFLKRKAQPIACQTHIARKAIAFLATIPRSLQQHHRHNLPENNDPSSQRKECLRNHNDQNM